MLVLALIVTLIPSRVFAADYNHQNPYYLYTATPNIYLISNQYLVANAQSNDGTLFTDLKVSWEIKQGDTVKVVFYNRSSNQISTVTLSSSSNLSARNVSVDVPAGAYALKLILDSGSAEGNRYFWVTYAATTNSSLGYTTNNYFPDPTIEPDPVEPPVEPPPSQGGDQPGGGDTSQTIVIDNSEMVSLLQQLLVKLDGFSCICNNLQIISGKLDQLTFDINAHFGVIEGQLEQINDDMNTHFENIEEKFDELNDYLMTPRTPDSYTNQDIPGVSFDPTPPEIEEDYAEPYVYDRPDPIVPDPIDSPPPLPTNPDPTIMEHDLPIAQDNPVSPAAPVTPTAPLQPDAASMDPPLAKTPVTMNAPLERDQVSMDQPITQNAPITKDSPATPDPAKARQAPLAPTPPIEPTPPE